MQYLRSLFFIFQMYLVMLIMAIGFTPFVIVNRRYAYSAVHTYCRWVRWTARLIVGLRSEVRGPVPETEVIVASKHQSFFDIILLVSVLPRPKFIMKSSLRFAPIVGYYADRIGCVPVNRGKRAEAIRKMVAGVTAGDAPAGQLVIFPQGTRVAPGAHLPYKIGTYVIYSETVQACVPAATNVGVFWPRHGILRRPGLAVVEFLPPITPGASREDFMAQLESSVEANSDRLMAEAGFPVATRG
ncbi:lysophospholipid acyltransferase family protein [Pseudooceanicola onchidii]|uniref:lysophospholipid acyltransferase family protein n=1 Tax=Pseudooceanicola onchidii TaxID=2562279 RepID=UPI0010AA6C3A|nr:lysophospholipid acyltransferase family protein [Pseudooceanicola onchidii]